MNSADTRRLTLEQLIVEQSQISPLHRAAPLDTICVQRADHDALAPCLTQHLRNSVAVAHQRAALGTRLQHKAGAALTRLARGMAEK
ncbi:hypothetical protein AWB67_05719 [Caballeronia terrestris]|uniref:Uncharacterized protein n=1 Tax=Caballeronia terrestris TaxID=1226301 RepID=A0A158KIP4_9BURK|nr:hypothetical protein [Caballeronia terrestris]SAL80924.1 hypothetical protein AWB67_05719 [Caballeronia terrestris]